MRGLDREELAKLAAYIAKQDKLSWDEQLEEDFSPGGKHASALEKIDAEIDAGNFRPAVKSHTLASFWQSYDALPERIQRLAKKNFALFKGNPRHPS